MIWMDQLCRMKRKTRVHMRNHWIVYLCKIHDWRNACTQRAMPWLQIYRLGLPPGTCWNASHTVIASSGLRQASAPAQMPAIITNKNPHHSDNTCSGWKGITEPIWQTQSWSANFMPYKITHCNTWNTEAWNLMKFSKNLVESEICSNLPIMLCHAPVQG